MMVEKLMYVDKIVTYQYCLYFILNEVYHLKLNSQIALSWCKNSYFWLWSKHRIGDRYGRDSCLLLSKYQRE